MNNFNLVAPFYEPIKKMIFGNHLYRAESYWVHQIKPKSRVIILGGGNGDILKKLPVNCEVLYIDLSEKMLMNARKQSYVATVNFIQADFLEYKFDQRYDWIIANFFLDVFTKENLFKAIHKISSLLITEGRLLVTDFKSDGSIYGKLLLKSMHIFFGLFSRLESKQLQPIKLYMMKQGFIEEQGTEFLNGKVFSIIFKKNGNL